MSMYKLLLPLESTPQSKKQSSHRGGNCNCADAGVVREKENRDNDSLHRSRHPVPPPILSPVRANARFAPPLHLRENLGGFVDLSSPMKG
jgi:hypothetical protein